MYAFSVCREWHEAYSLIGLVAANSTFPDQGLCYCITLFVVEGKKRSLERLRGEIAENRGSLDFINSLITLFLILDCASEEFIVLKKLYREGSVLSYWQVALLSYLAVSLSKMGEVVSLIKNHPQETSKTALNLMMATFSLEEFHTQEAETYLEAVGEIGTVEKTWYDHLVLKKKLLTCIVDKSQTIALNRQNRENLPRVALTLSGFLRGYTNLQNIVDFIERHIDTHEIDVFCQIFDRLGNLILPEGLPQELCDYSHGGFYREIMKTRSISIDFVKTILRPSALRVDTRLPDEDYIAKIGISHPQWFAVHQAFNLLEDYPGLARQPYEIVIRGRYDRDYSTVDLSKIRFEKNTVYTPCNHVFGHEDYGMCDMFAMGDYQSMKIYCAIGIGKNFRSVEELPVWKEKLSKWTASHETHLRLWLEHNGIGVEKPDWLETGSSWPTF